MNYSIDINLWPKDEDGGFANWASGPRRDRRAKRAGVQGCPLVLL